MSFRLRLGSVRMKSGGATLKIMRNDSAERTVNFLKEDATKAAESETAASAVGYAIVLWGGDGAYFASSHIDRGQPVSATQLPDFVRNALRYHRFEREMKK